MILAVILLGVGVLWGLAQGGKLNKLGEVEFKFAWLVFAGLGLQIAAELVGAFIFRGLGNSVAGLVILALSYGCLIAFLALNLQRPGALFIGAGLALNLLVILLNQSMPVSVRAAQAAGIQSVRFLEAAVKHQVMSAGTKLSFLGDVIPVPVIGTVVSVGDVLIGVGMFVLVSRIVGYRPKRLSGRVRAS
jgi:hypothetical protein